ncbi:hydrolase/acyltransferase [Chengkuizengella axinellae]|uniref:Hydrolase/acyltransferase n=1 Tax=Chengkuizengella axinellae TaxID=3064388 RepID=A0ABT9J4C8_9BACL|nr:hydrolase/acyltransferase [Chengkuizengella sp. 2205SS18-9]MDP5276317.1 hydrolase/acyltransferase [Chengkuizengella sp. 2205SS18-9]
MTQFKYVILQLDEKIEFVEMPSTHAYQLSALNRRLHKELDKLTADNAPKLPIAIAECDNLESIQEGIKITDGLTYMSGLEKEFSSTEETSYPLISLLTEIRALLAQLEQWYEEEVEA